MIEDGIERAIAEFRAFGEHLATARNAADALRLWEEWEATKPLPDHLTWQADSLGGVPVEWMDRHGLRSANKLLFVHGGGFRNGSGKTHRRMIAALGNALGCSVAAIEYRLAPEHGFPAGVDDVARACRSLASSGQDMKRVIVAGDSAGCNLMLSAMLSLRSDGERLPAAAVCIGPWVDLAVDGGSMIFNADRDPVVKRAGMKATARSYLADTSPYDPRASPIYADLTGLPPLLIQVGSGEALLDDARRLAGRAAFCGVTVRLTEWDAMVHGWHQFEAYLQGAREALDEIGAFARALPAWKG